MATDLEVTGLRPVVHRALPCEADILLLAVRLEVVREVVVRRRVGLPRCVAALLHQAILGRAVGILGDMINTAPCLLASHTAPPLVSPMGLTGMVPASRRPNHSTEMNMGRIKTKVRDLRKGK